ncbi:hypothetical protein NKG05_21465 [Oerskovia sp. M15]
MTSTIDHLPAPTATRLRRPTWRDPRLVLGIVIVAGSVALGSWAVSSAGGPWPCTRPLVRSPRASPSTRARSVPSRSVSGRRPEVLRRGRALPAELVALRVVGDGELVPRSAVGDPGDLGCARWRSPSPAACPTASRTVRSSTSGSSRPRPTHRQQGGRRCRRREPDAPRELVGQVVVAQVAEAGGTLVTGGATTLHVLVPTESLPEVLAALAAEERSPWFPSPAVQHDDRAHDARRLGPVRCAWARRDGRGDRTDEARVRVAVARRCADLAELLAAAAPGGHRGRHLGRSPGIDRQAVAHLHEHGVRVVALTDEQGWLAERLRAIGIDVVLDEDTPVSVLVAAVRDEAQGRRADGAPPGHRRAARRGLLSQARRRSRRGGEGRRGLGSHRCPGRTTLAVHMAGELAGLGPSRGAAQGDADARGARSRHGSTRCSSSMPTRTQAQWPSTWGCSTSRPASPPRPAVRARERST